MLLALNKASDIAQIYENAVVIRSLLKDNRTGNPSFSALYSVFSSLSPPFQNTIFAT